MIDDIALTSDGLIKNLLNNLPTGYTKKLVSLPNGKFTTPSSTKWLRASFINLTKNNVEAGGSYKRSNALFVIDSFYPKGQGDQAQLKDLKLIGDLYENQQIGNSKCFEAEPKTIGVDGSWFHCQVIVGLYYEGV